MYLRKTWIFFAGSAVTCFLCFFVSCKVQKKQISQGLVEVNSQIYNPDSSKYITIGGKLKILFLDSMVIEKRLNSRNPFVFIHLPTRTFSQYNNFSDTARLIKNYTQPDSAFIEDGWNFYAKHDMKFREPFTSMTDTVIENTTYQRVRLSQVSIIEKEKHEIIAIASLRCDKKGSMFMFDNDLSEKLGCPVAKIEYLASIKYPLSSLGELNFISDTLSSHELKIFEKWKQNALSNPVVH